MTQSKQHQSSRAWFYARLLIIAGFAISGPALLDGGPQDIPSSFVVVSFFFVICVVPFQLRYAMRRTRGRSDWSRPTWLANPFSQALGVFHLGSFCAIGIGVSATAFAEAHHQSLSLALFPLALGLGFYCALRVFDRFFYAVHPRPNNALQRTEAGRRVFSVRRP